jgi:hypothetical protein
MDNWFVGLALLVGFYWVAHAITNGAEEIAERLDQFLVED